MPKTTESVFEDSIEEWLVAHEGFDPAPSEAHDPALALLPDQVIAFIAETQPKAWQKIVSHYGAEASSFFIRELVQARKQHGTLSLLRQGMRCFGQTFRLLYFRPTHEMNPEAEALYQKNRLQVLRQVRFNPATKQSLDMVLAVNGIPVLTMELKNELTGQNVEHAKEQYKRDRDPRHPLLQFKTGALVHFAVDQDEVYMTTKLDGPSTFFLPFNRGNHGAAGNEPVQDDYRTSYLWKEVLAKDSLLDILHRFVHLQREEKVVDTSSGPQLQTKETMIFPRYHQLDVVRKLVAHSKEHGAGKNYLVQHSAGSGKSNSIAWLAHRLSSLHDGQNQKIFSSVIVITDRVVLDNQLQDTVYQFEHKTGVVAKIDQDSTQLAEALNAGTPIIISTIQKFPFITQKVESLTGKRFAVIVDEAHSSQSGETAAELKGILNRAGIKEEVQRQALEEGLSLEEQVILEQVRRRGHQNNLSFYAYTATPKYKTKKIFNEPGDSGEAPFHLYTMRQAIEEGFIMDVLKHYTTYNTYFQINKKTEDDPEIEKHKGKRALTRFLTLHPYNIDQKVMIMVEHFRQHTRHKIGGRAKAMVVTASRLAAVRYKQAFDRYLQEKGYTDMKTLVAFSGTVEDPDDKDLSYTEVGMNNGLAEKKLPKEFAGKEYQVLIVAEKFQTGFDQPLLHTMYVDKRLSGVQAVQTLSRLNRMCPGKEDTFVLDFVNDAEEIYESFKPYFEFTPTGEDVEPRKLYEMEHKIMQYRILDQEDLHSFSAVFFNPQFKGSEGDHAKLYAIMDPVIERWKGRPEEEQEDIRGSLNSYKNLYQFMSQLIPFSDTTLERLYTFVKFLLKRLPRRDSGDPVDIRGDVELKYYKIQKQSEGQIPLYDGDARPLKGPGDVGTGKVQEEIERLSELIEQVNARFGTDFTKADEVFFDQMHAEALEDEHLAQAAKVNPEKDFALAFDKRFNSLLMNRLDDNQDIVNKLFKNEDMRALVMSNLMKKVYQSFVKGG